jgi:hydroxymethylpyrimidine pyrophosphatase-like HAD family hydrolase
MTFVALAADYDGTIAHHGRVDQETLDSLKWLKTRGKWLFLVTGRELPELQSLMPELSVFDAVVAENGALLFLPAKGEMKPLGPPPPAPLVAALREQGVTPLSVGSSIVATWEPNEKAVLELVRDLGLEWQIIFNKGAVMCLPPGINKASGLKAALAHFRLSPLNTVGVGDAENDHAFLTLCGASAAVSNALPAVIETADIRLKADHGAGVRELIQMWVGEDGPGLDIRDIRTGRTSVSVAAEPGAAEGRLYSGADAVLIAGESGAGKSTLAKALVERGMEAGAQVVVIDPEGDYGNLDGIVHLGDAERPPKAQEAIDLVTEKPGESVVVNLLGLSLSDRPAFFAEFVGGIAALRARYGRPHWIVVDEAHHFLPAELEASEAAMPQDASGFVFVTVTPDALAGAAIEALNTVVGVGPPAAEVLAMVAKRRGISAPKAQAPDDEHVLLWRLEETGAEVVAAAAPRQEHTRHIRKYAEGELSEEKSFFFRGAEDKLNLRARNLNAFNELADGVDEETWLFHLRAHDYSRWLRESIGDEELAEEVSEIEDSADSAEASRQQIRAAIERRYTAAAKG